MRQSPQLTLPLKVLYCECSAFIFILLPFCLLILSQYYNIKRIVDQKMNTNSLKGKPKKKNISSQPNLLQKITGIVQQKQPQEIQCKYGIYCAHLRANGKCKLPHRRNHYLFLNLVPPLQCLQDKAQDPQKQLSKRQKKQKKIMQKTIKENIDVEALQRQQKLLMENQRNRIKVQIESSLLEQQKYVIRLVQSPNSTVFYDILNAMDRKQFDIFEIKKRAMILLKKKNQKLYDDVIDKQYRIAHRLIKEALKRKKQDIFQIYKDINHDTLPAVREYFQTYFVMKIGIPQQNNIQQDKNVVHLQKLLPLVFRRDANSYENQYYFLSQQQKNSGLVKANIQLYNMLVPSEYAKKATFNIFLFMDSERQFSFYEISRYFNTQIMRWLHIKPKPYPQYPFGKLQENHQKCQHWLTKIYQKFAQNNKETNFVLILDKFDSLISAKQNSSNQIEQQRQKQRNLCLKVICQIFSPILFLISQDQKAVQQYSKSDLQSYFKGSKLKKQLDLIKQ